MMEKLKARFVPLVKPESNLIGAMREERCGNHARTRLFYDEAPKELFQLSERVSGLNVMKICGIRIFWRSIHTEECIGYTWTM